MSKRLATRHRRAPARQYAGMVGPIVESRAEQTLASHDGGLLERARTQWQFGDWQSLAQINLDTLEHYPERAKLALLAAAGRLQTGGNDSEARQLIRLAQSWGTSRKLINQILIAGVHNSLGRAAAISNQQQRASQHFEKAITVGVPGSDTKLLTRARSSEQLSQLGLPASENCVRTAMGEATAAVPESPSFTKNLETIISALGQQKAEFDAQFKKQADEFIRVSKFLDGSLKKVINNATRQLHAAAGLDSYWKTGELPTVNTESHAWPISPDFGLYLVTLLEQNDYDLVIEFGSGISTVIIAKTLVRLAHKRVDKFPVAFTSFDHLEQYYRQTFTMLQQANLTEYVELHHAPLQAWQAPNGDTYSYYDCHQILAILARQYPSTGLRVLVVVDGPPGKTGPHARYPAAPLVLKHFAGACIDLLLDDYIRQDEKEIAQLWQADYVSVGLQFRIIERKLERDACLISIYSERIIS